MEFAICINNTDYSASLEIRKIYQVLPDHQANNHQMIRIIDESGEDYLYPSGYFIAILPQEQHPKTFLETAQSLQLQGDPDWSEKIDILT